MVALFRTALAGLVFATIGSVAAAEFRPLSEVAVSESSDANSFYVAASGGVENRGTTAELDGATDNAPAFIEGEANFRRAVARLQTFLHASHWPRSTSLEWPVSPSSKC